MARCAWCGREFSQRNVRHTHCSRECQYMHQKAENRRRYATDPDYRALLLSRNAAWRERHSRGVRRREAMREMDREEAARACAAALSGGTRLMAMIVCGATLKQLEREWLGGD